MRFVLINVEGLITGAGEHMSVYRMWPHLGILTVGTAVSRLGIEVVLWDELVQGFCDLGTLMQPGDIVGLSLVTSGMMRGLELAHEAQRLGAVAVIAGNDSAIFRARQLLHMRDSPFDAVCVSNNVSAVALYVQALVSGNVPHAIADIVTREHLPLCNRSNETAVLAQEASKRRVLPEDIFVVPDLALFSSEYWATVRRSYRAVLGHKHAEPGEVRNALALFAQGCTRTGGREACAYCSIADVAVLKMPERHYLESLVQAYAQAGVTHVFNTTDSSFEMKSVACTLHEIGAQFRHGLTIYGRAWGMAHRPDCIEAWQEIAGERLVINSGFDSGSDTLLSSGVVKASVRGSRLSENRQAVRNIKASGAHLHVSFIFGSPGETRESCQQTLELFDWIRLELGAQLQVCESDIFWLNHGSPASRVFHSYEYAQELAMLAGNHISHEEWQREFAQHSDTLVVPMNCEDAWYRFFTQIEQAYAHECIERIAASMREHEGSILARRYAFAP